MSKHGAALLLEKDTYRIGEVASLAEIEPHVLRYWETEFPALRPTKAPSGQRLYRRTDIDTVLVIKRLLYEEGFTIAGARKQLVPGNGHPQPTAPVTAPEPPSPNGHTERGTMEAVRDELVALLTLLSHR
jgi:DNA-binding transcriptional MerR regulator